MPGMLHATTLSGVKILAVRDNLASISAGAKHGIKAGTKLLILREKKLVGILDIVEVASGASAGVVSNSKNGVKAGDDVQVAP